MKTMSQYLRTAWAALPLVFLLIQAPSLLADPDFSLDTARVAADKGDAKAEFFLGKAYAKGDGVPQDEVKAAGYYRQAADQGYAPAQNNLGVAYHRGLGVQADDTAAAQWFRKAAEQGDAFAELSLGHCYAKGRGVPQNGPVAVKWLSQAAGQKQSDALLELGDIYYFGDTGVKMDLKEAFKYYRQAADMGRWECLNALGQLYEKGQGTNRNFDQARKCYRAASAKGDAKAMMNMGLMYEQGMGVPKDSVEAYKWLTLAVRRGDLIASHYLDELSLGVIVSPDQVTGKGEAKPALSPSQIAEANRRADEYEQAPQKFGD